MRLVTLTSNISRPFGLKGAIKLIKDSGFDGYDCSLFAEMRSGGYFSGDDYLERAKEIREYADSVGLPCLQTHSPCPSLRTYEDILNYGDDQIRAIEITAILGAPIVVIHPACITDAEGNYEMIYSKLLPHAKAHGVKIATENMFSWKDIEEGDTVPSACGTAADFVRYIDYVSDENFTACLDLGHASMMNCEGAPKMIYALGHDRLTALHVHDNDCLHDDHIFPFAGKMNWDDICKALADIDYSGDFTFEANEFLKGFPDELIPTCMELLEKTGRYLISKTEAYK